MGKFEKRPSGLFSNYPLYYGKQQTSIKAIEVHIVGSDIIPTGMGEPSFPPAFEVLANTMYKAAAKRFYNQPFISQLNSNNG